MALLDFPTSPTPGQLYAAPNGVTYQWDNTVGTGVWLTSGPAPALTVTAGSISGTPAVGQVLTYTPGTASGGTAPYTYAQQWYANGSPIAGATGTSYTVLAGDAGKAITVTITANDSAAGTATATTSPVNIPGPLSIASAGTITGTAVAGSTLTYSVGSASGGTPPYTYTWEWKKESDNSVLQTGGTTYLIPGSLIGGRVYVTLTATDSVAATASGNTAAYPASPATITGSPFLSVFSPAGAPNASPASVSIPGESLYGTASCANWIDGSTSLTSTGGIQFRVGAGVYGTGPTAVANGNTVDVIWNPATIAAAADGATLTGTLTDGTYTNTYTITIDRAVATLSFANLTGQATSTAVTSAVGNPSGFNVPVSMSFSGTATNPLTTPLVSVDGATFSASPQTVNPGNTLQLKGTTGASNSTSYGVDFSIGSSAALTGSWTATTVSAVPSVATPSILTPANNSSVFTSPRTITSSTYTPLNGAGTHASSSWEVYEGGKPLTSTNSITAVGSAAGYGSSWSVSATLSAGATSKNCLVYAEGLFVLACGVYGIYTSPDGITWTNRLPSPVGGGAACVYYDATNAYFVGGGDSGTIYTSPDGVTWTNKPTGFTQDINTVGTNGNTLVAGGTSGTGNVYRSTDAGTTWTLLPGASGVAACAPREILYQNGVWVVLSNSGSIYRSTDNGATWSQVSAGLLSLSTSQMARNGNTWVAVANNGKIAVSTDNAATWVAATVPASWSTSQLYSVTYHTPSAKFFVCGGPTGAQIYGYSTDGLTWSDGSGSGGLVIVSNGSSVVSGGYSGTPAQGSYLLGNGTTLTTLSLPTNATTGIQDFAFGNNRWVGIASLAANSLQTITSGPNADFTITVPTSDGFRVGDTIISDPVGAGPAVIQSVTGTQIVVSPYSSSWAVGQKIKRVVTQIVPPPANPNTTNLTSISVAVTSGKWYGVRVLYTSVDPVSSSYSNWSEFERL